MIQTTRVIGDRTFVITSEEFLVSQAEWLLELIEGIERNRRIDDGMKIQVGWAILSVREQNGVVKIVAPDFDTNPFTETAEDLSVFLSVQLSQNHVLRKLSMEGEASLFQDKIVVAKGAMDVDRIYLERSMDQSEGDSGWYLGTVDGDYESPEIEAYYIFQLLKIRPSILKALAVPRGYLVVFDKENIEAIVDENDRNIWGEA